MAQSFEDSDSDPEEIIPVINMATQDRTASDKARSYFNFTKMRVTEATDEVNEFIQEGKFDIKKIRQHYDELNRRINEMNKKGDILKRHLKVVSATEAVAKECKDIEAAARDCQGRIQQWCQDNDACLIESAEEKVAHMTEEMNRLVRSGQVHQTDIQSAIVNTFNMEVLPSGTQGDLQQVNIQLAGSQKEVDRLTHLNQESTKYLDLIAKELNLQGPTYGEILNTLRDTLQMPPPPAVTVPVPSTTTSANPSFPSTSAFPTSINLASSAIPANSMISSLPPSTAMHSVVPSSVSDTALYTAFPHATIPGSAAVSSLPNSTISANLITSGIPSLVVPSATFPNPTTSALPAVVPSSMTSTMNPNQINTLLNAANFGGIQPIASTSPNIPIPTVTSAAPQQQHQLVQNVQQMLSQQRPVNFSVPPPVIPPQAPTATTFAAPAPVPPIPPAQPPFIPAPAAPVPPAQQQPPILAPYANFNPHYNPHYAQRQPRQQPQQQHPDSREQQNTADIVAFYMSLPEPWNVIPETPVAMEGDLIKNLQAMENFLQFDGDRRSWFPFSDEFSFSVHQVKYPISVKVRVLKKVLKQASKDNPETEAAAMLKMLASYTTGPAQDQYAYILRTLEQFYGKIQGYLQILTQEMTNCELRQNNIGDVMSFLSKVEAFIAASRRRMGTAYNPDLMYNEHCAIYHGLAMEARLAYDGYLVNKGVTNSNIETLRDFLRERVTHMSGLIPIQSNGHQAQEAQRRARVNQRLYLVDQQTGEQFTATVEASGLEKKDEEKKDSTGDSTAPPRQGALARGSESRTDPNGVQKNVASKSNYTGPRCPCGAPYHIWLNQCDMFMRFQIKDRRKWVGKNKFCYRCLKPGHGWRDCKMEGKPCKKCNRNHHTLLHDKDFIKNKEEYQAMTVLSGVDDMWPEYPSCACLNEIDRVPSDEEEFVSVIDHYTLKADNGKTDDEKTDVINHEGRTATGIIPCLIEDSHENALRDSGSTCSIIDETLVKELGLTGHEVKTTLMGLGASKTAVTTEVTFRIRNVKKDKGFRMKAKVVKNMCGGLKPIDWKSLDVPHFKSIEFPQPNLEKGVRLLIGQDCPQLMESHKTIRARGPNTPYADKTVLGWVAQGPVPRLPSFTMHADPLEADKPYLCGFENEHHTFMGWSTEERGESILDGAPSGLGAFAPGSHMRALFWDSGGRLWERFINVLASFADKIKVKFKCSLPEERFACDQDERVTKRQDDKPIRDVELANRDVRASFHFEREHKLDTEEMCETATNSA